MTTQALSALPQKFDDVTVPLDNMRHEFGHRSRYIRIRGNSNVPGDTGDG